MIRIAKWVMLMGAIVALLAIVPAFTLPSHQRTPAVLLLLLSAAMQFAVFAFARWRLAHPVVSTLSTRESNIRVGIFWSVMLGCVAAVLFAVRHL